VREGGKAEGAALNPSYELKFTQTAKIELASSDCAHKIYLEVGQQKVFAIAVDWPGWCRSGKDEQSAVRRLIEAAPRYAQVAKAARLEFSLPQTSAQVDTVARLEGNTTTDFGAPDAQLPHDWDPLGAEELDRLVRVLKACWLVFDQIAAQAAGKELRKGPRGGGRPLAKISEHVLGAEEAYLKSLGWKHHGLEGETIEERIARVRGEVIQGLHAAVEGQLPRKGPRGREHWSPRFFVRRLAWHVVDHAWEIEDRAV
jgi:hypothetical protein